MGQVQDVLNGNTLTPAHSWKFKQLHIILDSLPTDMKSLILSGPSDSVNRYGSATNLHFYGAIDTSIRLYWHPDSLVSSPGRLGSEKDLIEIRVLSTYRATVRARSLEYRDTALDNFFYRRRITADSTHSLTPFGAIGGYDSLVLADYHLFYDSLHGKPREHEMNDTRHRWGPLCMPALGYLEALGSKYNQYVHVHEQDFADYSRDQRRERLSYDGKPPSMFESIVAQGVPMILPRDYVFNALSPDYSHPWPLSHTDSMLNCLVTRGDSSYSLYAASYGMGFLRWLRLTTSLSLKHPASRRSAVESSVMGWGYMSTGRWDSSGILVRTGLPGYGSRPTTSEENTAQIFGAFANGVTIFSNAQPINLDDGGSVAGGTIGITGVKYHTNFDLTSNYNFGHRYSAFTLGKFHDLDTLLPEYFLGYAANFRSQRYAISRLDQLYDTIGGNKHPLKHLTWMDAYSAHGALGYMAHQSVDGGSERIRDTISYHAAFLKVARTKAVNRWSRAGNSYLDSVSVDDSNKTFVEVGLFIDSSGASPNYAGLLVNTRTFPSLRDADELSRYSAGLDRSADQPASSMGDIDVRKVHLKIDTAQFPSNFRTTYYVVRDLWHQDSSWLVHRDSQFAVYIKPGDAKFLYFEKGIAIDVARNARGDTGRSDTAEFCFNNGNRVAERYHGTRSIVTYTRNHKLYAAYPAAGSTFSGMPEQSSGDNIVTGFEIPVDTSHYCARPSIRTGFNDSTIAIVYAIKDSATSWRIGVAYQRSATDSIHRFVLAFPFPLPDASSDMHLITPDITQVNDTAWFASYGAHLRIPFVDGIFASLIWGRPSQPWHDTAFLQLASDFDRAYDGGIDSNNLALFGSLGSRPVADTIALLKMVWQAGHGGHNQI